MQSFWKFVEYFVPFPRNIPIRPIPIRPMTTAVISERDLPADDPSTSTAKDTFCLSAPPSEDPDDPATANSDLIARSTRAQMARDSRLYVQGGDGICECVLM